MIEIAGRTVEDAVERALDQLGLTHEDVEIEVLDSGARGVLGLGSRDARVRVRPRVTPAVVTHRLTEQLMQAMGVPATVRVREQNGGVAVEIAGGDLAALIGHHGNTLEAIGVLLEAMVARRTGSHARIVVDVAGYRERRRLALEGIAKRAADRVVREDREVALDPMEPHERRIIHTVLAGHPRVITFSRGEGISRGVVIAPRSPESPAAPDVDA